MLIQEWLHTSDNKIKVYIHTTHGPSVPKIETLKEILKKTMPNGKTLLPISIGFESSEKSITFQHDYLFVEITIDRTFHLHEIKTIVDAIMKDLT